MQCCTRVINTASQNPSSIEGMDTVWRGKGKNPHPFTGKNADGTAAKPNQMKPCTTCAANVEVYREYANKNKD